MEPLVFLKYCLYAKLEIQLIHSLYKIAEDVKLDPDSTSSFISGCEFDYSANTYRLQVTTSSGSVTIGENFVIVKVDGATGMPKVLSVGWSLNKARQWGFLFFFPCVFMKWPSNDVSSIDDRGEKVDSN